MNKCQNCKYIKYNEYTESSCTRFFVFDSSNGMYDKQYKIANKIRKNRELCPHYEPSTFMRFKIRLGKLQRWWYLKKCPDKLI